MPFCRSCGKEISETDVYCPSCGVARFNKDEKPKNTSDHSETIGIVAIIAAFIWPEISIVLAIIGLSLASKWANSQAKRLNIIAIILAPCLLLIYLILGLLLLRFYLPVMGTFMSWFQAFIDSHLSSSSSVIRAII